MGKVLSIVSHQKTELVELFLNTSGLVSRLRQLCDESTPRTYSELHIHISLILSMGNGYMMA